MSKVRSRQSEQNPRSGDAIEPESSWQGGSREEMRTREGPLITLTGGERTENWVERKVMKEEARHNYGLKWESTKVVGQIQGCTVACQRGLNHDPCRR